VIVLDAAAAEPQAGAKAQTLARARAAGVAVPDGIVLLPGEEIDEKAIVAALSKIAPDEKTRFAVRSSADVEDRADASAAGVFESVLEVSLASIVGAIERVRQSGQREAARAYLGSRGISRARVAVLIQPMVPANALGVLHTQPLSDGKMSAEERAPSEPEWGEVSPKGIDVDDPIAKGAAHLAALVGGAADVEYARTDAGPIFLQARPLTAPIRLGSDGDWDPGDDETWRRDAEHNPDPLSAAQASLVARVQDLPGAPVSRVIGGYLFYRRETAPGKIIPPQDLPRKFSEEIAPACDAILAPLEKLPIEQLALSDALAAYRAVLARYLGEITPSLAKARAHLDQLLRANLGEGLEANAALLAGTGDTAIARDVALFRIGRSDPATRATLVEEYLARFGACAPAWDVAVPTDDELPMRVMAMAGLVARGGAPEQRHAAAVRASEQAASATIDRLDRMGRGAFKHLLPVVRAALVVAEEDDLLFFRAQRIVRRALLSQGIAAATIGRLDDPALIFELSIDEVERDAIDPQRASDQRLLREERKKISPPSEIRARRPTFRAASGGVLRGAGTSGRGWGRAFVLRDPVTAPPSLPQGAILVTPAILPSLGHLIPNAAGLITDFGGALSHGATIAREYGVPAVLGTGVATRVLRDGEDLLVDADSGRIYRIAGG
jgi:pyruvate,water dikinase